MSGTHTGRGVRGRERGGEGGCGWVLAERAVLAQQLQLPDALLPSLLPHADRRPNGYTGPSRHVRERNVRITNCPRVQRRLPDLHCKCITEINTGNTYPAGVQSKYMGPVQQA